MSAFLTILYCISLVIAALTIILGIYAGIYCSKSIRILPNALRLHMIFCYYIFVILHCLLTIIICIVYFFTNNQTHYIILNLRLIIVFPCQFLRNYFFTVVFERIIATILLEKYQISYDTSLFVILLICSQIITVIFVGYFYYGYFGTAILPNFNYGVFGFHVLTIVIFLILYFLNQKMYKVTAYRVTLKKRHQIMENVKVLSFLFIPILTFTLLAPIGPLITIIGVTYKQLPTMPYCILHIFYNLPLGIIFLRQILSKKCKYANSKIKHQVIVKSALGKSISTKSDTETYFQKLNLQWK